MYHSCRLRTGRISIPGQIYLITANCKSRRPVFNTIQAARAFVHALQDAQTSAETLAYVVMPDHIHWLMQLGDRSTLSDTVRFVKSRTTTRLRLQSDQPIEVWQSGFHDRQLRKEDDLVNMARYVIANPVRAGLVRSVREYAFWDAVWI